MLSERSTANNTYLVQRAGQAIAAGKHAEYTSDLMARGFQFERLASPASASGRWLVSELCAV